MRYDNRRAGIRRGRLGLGLLGAALAGVAICACTSGIGGTGMHTASGIGGTGKTETGGVGGSGVRAGESGIGGTGIVGTITGFGSIRVNGIEVLYDRNTPVKVDGRPAGTEVLRRDQVVAVFAQGEGDRLQARMILVNHAVVGPVTASGAAGFEVMGIRVHAGRRTGIETGDFVAVSGYWRPDGAVDATRITRIPPRETVSVAGRVMGTTRSTVTVGGTKVDLTGTAVLPEEARGRSLLAMGRWTGSGILADRAQINPVTPFCVRARELSLEGYIEAVNAGRSFRMLGSVVVVPDRSTRDRFSSLKVGQLVRVRGPVEPNRRVHAQELEVLRP